MSRRVRERLTWLALTVFFGLQIRHDFLGIMDPTFKMGFQEDSDSLVRDLMLDPGPGVFPLLGGVGREYPSQFGLQGVVMNWASPGDLFYEQLRLVTCFLTAAVFATAVVAAGRVWGRRAAVVLAALLTLSFWTNVFGASTYWQLWTFFLPTLVPLLVWPRLGSGRGKWVKGGVLIAALVFLRCLNGYEFISTVLLGAAAAVAFHEFRGRVDRRFLAGLVGTMAAGVVGFGLAVGVHVLQLLARFGDASIIEQRLEERTFDPSDVARILESARAQGDPVWGWLLDGDGVVGLWSFRMVHYLLNPAVSLPAYREAGFGFSSFGLPVYLFVLVFVALAIQAWRGRQVDAPLQRRLAVAAGLGLLGAFSWMLLAVGHMLDHPHLDTIVFYLPFLPFVFAMISVRLATISYRAWPSHRGGQEHAGGAVLREASGTRRPVDAGTAS
ncbi:hypothetical protein TEK04_11290 [Klenkia sp. LSe6-5]|uniref:Dolichyl-phosphate-mannose-protein mannosyltransferase n=1 Tax=Klenkia sesuvii TaxID=3103137 RepID=A0ABU8DTX0_9ACTN